MLHPSYSELLETLNKVNRKNGYDEIASRYGLVIAVSRRARALQENAPATVYKEKDQPMLSVAIDEMRLGNLAVETFSAEDSENMVDCLDLNSVDLEVEE